MPDELGVYLEGLRDASPEVLLLVYKKLLDDAFKEMEDNLSNRAGDRKRRVFCFGPYPNGGWQRIDAVAKKVSEFGYSALTGFGYYRANQPDQIRPLDEILSPIVMDFSKIIPGHTFFHEIVKIAGKATFDMTVGRGQSDELRGCYDYRIPSLGFITRETIERRPDETIKPRPNCVWLSNYGSYWGCEAWAKSLCEGNRDSNIVCPFYAHKMPWFSLQLFLTKENYLIAARNLDDVNEPLKQFLDHGSPKNLPD